MNYNATSDTQMLGQDALTFISWLFPWVAKQENNS